MHVSSRSCPDCGADLDRIPRRFIDRVSSLLFPSQRYRCRTFACRWEGNLRELRQVERDRPAN